MEKRKEKLSTLKLCRFCLAESDSLENLYEGKRTSKKDTVNLHLKILTCVSVEVFPSDKMPCFICKRCDFLMNMFYEYKRIVRQADENILQYIQSGSPLQTILWPSSLIKATKHSGEFGVMKTIVEGGTTVQVSSQDASESDEEEANVYNIKIGNDGDGEAKTTCIKVVASKDSQDSIEDIGRKGFSSVPKLARHVRSHAGERPYPCKYCNKSFTKSHHYTRHLRVKHREEVRNSREPSEQYRCEQCDDTFTTQDELIYHSAIHATQNLTCPLCQEKFCDVDAVTAHIKSHVTGDEFMCDFCELVFTSKDKLDNHLMLAHEDEMQQEAGDESSMDVDVDEEDDDDINVKEDDHNMVIEIKKPEEFIISNVKSMIEDKVENAQSEESEPETTYTELSTVDTLAMMNKQSPVKILSEKTVYKPADGALATLVPKEPAPPAANKSADAETAVIVRRAEEIKKKSVQQSTLDSIVERKERPSPKVESSGGASDKSLRLLEKELQDLKRTNSRNDTSKGPTKTMEVHKGRRAIVHTSTPKSRNIEEKKIITKSPVPTKKIAEKEKVVPTKENKEPKDVKESKNNGNGEKEKEKDTPKNVVKNGSNDKSMEEGIRRSTRPSKIRDYAKMVRDRPQAASDLDDSDDNDDDEYREAEVRPKPRRPSVKPSPKPVSAAASPPVATPVRKRGRPRKEPQKEVPVKVKKEETNTTEETKEEAKIIKSIKIENEENDLNRTTETNIESTTEDKAPPPPLLMSPTGQTLKKVPVKALPPGVKPLPLPVNARPVATGDLCEMQIGKKVVKVQKIVMTRAEVEAMAKKGLVEMKDGTMVLKQGIKLPAVDAANVKSTLTGESDVPSETVKKEKAAPSRCDLNDDS